VLNWRNYSNLVDQKCKDAKHNLEHAEKKFKEAQAIYLSVLREKESFENALEELCGREGE
jgi:hypothetical protein